MDNHIDTPENQNNGVNKVRETSISKKRTWIYRIICIVLFTSGIVFFANFLIKYQYIITLHYPLLRDMDLISVVVAAAMVVILVCFLRTFKKIPVFKIVALIIAGAVLAACWYFYFRYFPKYSYEDACAAVKSNPEYASLTIEPHYRVYSDVKNNHFCIAGYILNVVTDGKVTKWIEFDSTTGEYNFCDPNYDAP